MIGANRDHIAAGCFFVLMAVIGPFLDAFWLSLLTLVLLYAALGIAWNLMMGMAGLLSLGHALYVGLGAYATAVLSQDHGLSPWLSLAAGAVIAAIAGAAQTWLSCRFAVRGVHFALLTIAFAEFARVVFDNWSDIGATGGYFLKAVDPETNDWAVTLRGGATYFYFAFLTISALFYLLTARLMATRWGFWWRAIRADEDAARALGVPSLKGKIIIVAISAAMTALAGGLFGLLQGSLFPDTVMGIRMSIELLIAPIIGGLGTLFGPILGALFTVPMTELAGIVGSATGIHGINTLVYGAVVLGIIAFIPEGLWPRLLRLFRKKAPADAGRP